jgi:predicted CXXCH cytochrome family protein
MKMSSKSIQVVLMVACFTFSLSGMASGGIQYSKHDFSISSQDTGFGTSFGGSNFQLANTYPVEEICVFCHTPHNASSAGYLWNRTGTAATGYNMYTSSTLTQAIKDNMGNAPTGLTLMCMSCHDGITSIAAGTLANAPYYVDGRQQVELSDPFNGYSKIGDLYYGGFVGWGANIGNLNAINGTTADLTNDHPVSFTWVPGITGINPPASLLNGDWSATGGAELKLFNGRMECSTCHDVHNNEKAPFLRMSNVNSDMCLSCHDK